MNNQNYNDTYAIFTEAGIRVDLISFFNTPSGKKALKSVADSAKKIPKPKVKVE